MRFQTALILFLATAALCCADEPLAGRWSGKVEIPGHEVVLIVDLAHEANWTGSATLPGLNVKGAPLTDVAVQSPEIAFAIKAMSGPNVESPRVKARLADGKLTGEFLQSGNSAHFVLEKVGPPQVEQQPRSSTIAKEFEGEWKGEYELLGYPRKVTLKLQSHGTEPATADLVIVGRKVNNVPVDRVIQQGDFITIDSAAFGMTYEGRIKNSEIEGQLLQGPIETALILRRPK